ncbi:aldolase, partial [Candidatus Roizmanbacteria bacterium CG02_land_8_20_14_3_00_36_15]
DEWKEGQTEDQFIYKIRKKALGPFKQDLWQMDKSFKQTIMKNLKKQFLFLFEQLKVINTRSVLDQYV